MTKTHEQIIDKAVDRVFRVIGGGKSSTSAISIVAEDEWLDADELRAAYAIAVAKAAESD